MAKYTYEGNRDGSNTTSGLIYEGQGTVYDVDLPPEVRVGDTIELSVEERDRLSPYFILTNSAGNDPGEGLTPPTTVDPAVVVVPEGQTSGTDGNLGEKSSPSATSKKS